MNVNNYRITEKTLAIMPAHDLHYSSKIIELEEEINHISLPLSIIKENCLHYSSSYEGRKASVRHHLSFKQKTPIPIYPIKNLYVFPTLSEKSYECVWLFFHAVKKIESMQGSNKQQTAIHFINDQNILLDQSKYSIQTQYDRTGMCKVVFDVR